MSDPREDDLRTTYDEVASQLEDLAETEAAKQETRPGTKRHVKLAKEAKVMAEELRKTTAMQAALAEDLEEDPAPKPD